MYKNYPTSNKPCCKGEGGKCKCLKVVTKTNECEINMSSRRKCAERLKRFGFAIVGTQHITHNLPGGRGKTVYD